MRQRAAYLERVDLLWVLYYFAVGALAVRLVQMQVLRHVYYTQVAERNRTQVIFRNAPRGRIYDRNGVEVANSRPAFSLVYLPGKKEDPALLESISANLAEELHVAKDDLLDTLREAQREQIAMHLAENLPLKSMLKLSELKTIFPGVDLIVEARRHYPLGAFAGHLLGYMGKMDKNAWHVLKDQGYRADSWVGRTGLEGLFEDSLRGVDGEMRMEVDAQGRLKRTLEEASWSGGGNVRLAIDARIQKAVEDGLRASPSGQGGAVVMDPRNGDVLALASVPDFDPNVFMLPAWDPARKALRELPEFNHALSGLYAPGSTFKIITAAAMLNDGKVSPEEKVFCPGSFALGNRVFKCWVGKKGHRLQDFLAGLTHSCDVYFYTMGLRVGGAAIERYGKMFRIGEKTKIALPGEKSGNAFGPETRRSRGRPWYDGDTVNLSIGQGELLVTPVQMAVIISAVANRGTLWRPHFTKSIEYADGRPQYTQEPEAMGRVELSSRTWDLIQAALANVVDEGTGVAAKIPGITVAGKTGTAQTHGEDNAWFVAYAGREGEPPSLAVSVLVEHGGHGGAAAAPVARRAIEAAFDLAKAPAAPPAPAPAPAPPPPVTN